MGTKIEFFPENERERQILRKAEEESAAFNAALPLKYQKLSCKEFENLTKEEKLEYYQYLRKFYPETFDISRDVKRLKQQSDFLSRIRAGTKALQLHIHMGFKKHLDYLETLALPEQIDYYKHEIEAISEALVIYEITGVFEIHSFEANRCYRQNPPIEDFKNFKELLLIKLARCQKKISNRRPRSSSIDLNPGEKRQSVRKRTAGTSQVREIQIELNIINTVHQALAPYFVNTRLLLKVLKGELGTEQLLFKGNAKEFVSLFAYIFSKNKISNSKDEIANWICKNFKSLEKKQPKEFKLGSVTRYINAAYPDPPFKFTSLAANLS